MTNLLSNAAKHSPANSQILISAAQHEGNVRVAVSDKGPGVPEHFREHIFENFAQAEDSAHRVPTGTGLGLAISKSIVEQINPGTGSILSYLRETLIKSSVHPEPVEGHWVNV